MKKIFNLSTNWKSGSQNHTKKPHHIHTKLAEIYKILVILNLVKNAEGWEESHTG